MTRYANDWNDELENRNQGLQGAVAASNVVYNPQATPSNPYAGMSAPAAPAPAPVPSGSIAPQMAPAGPAAMLGVDPAAFDLLRMQGGARGSGGAGQSVAKDVQAKNGMDIVDESVAFPFAVNGAEKVAPKKPANIPGLAIAALLAMMVLGG